MHPSSDKSAREAIGARIHDVLAAKQISHSRAAREIGISQSFVSGVCRGESYPSVPLLVGLHAQYGVSTDWVLLGVGERYAVRTSFDHPLHGLLAAVMEASPAVAPAVEGYLKACLDLSGSAARKRA